MKRAHRVIVRACSFLAGHSGAWIIGLALVSMASLPGPAWGQSAWPSYPNNSAISVTSSGNVGIGPHSPLGILDVNTYGANTWTYFRANVIGNPSASVNIGLMTAWNPSGGGGETQVLYGTGPGADPQ